MNAQFIPSLINSSRGPIVHHTRLANVQQWKSAANPHRCCGNIPDQGQITDLVYWAHAQVPWPLGAINEHRFEVND